MKHKGLLSSISRSRLPSSVYNKVPTSRSPVRKSKLVKSSEYDKQKFVRARYEKTLREEARALEGAHSYKKKLSDIVFSEVVGDEGARYNSFGVQMIPDVLRKRIFSQPAPCLNSNVKQDCDKQLKKFGLNVGKPPLARSIDISLPPEMSDLPEFFDQIAREQLHPYDDYLNKLVKTETLPFSPGEWSRTPGWTKYTKYGHKSVPYPECDSLVFDVEVCIQNKNNLPALAVAMSPDYVYSWVSPALDKPWLYNRSPSTEFLIPLGNEQKVIVGHHVMYDRARVKEEYSETRSNLRFVDTQSLHVCVSGLENTQKGQWMAANSKNGKFDKEWMKVGSPNSLAATHKLYCGSDLDKSERDVFVSGTHQDVQLQFQSLTKYCAADVVATHNVLKEVWKLFSERMPSPVTLAGMFEMASSFIPINKNWGRYTTEADSKFYDMQGEIQKVLANIADETLLRYHLDQKKSLTDSWMSQLDWGTKRIMGVKNKKLSVKAQAEEDKRLEEDLNKVETISSIIDQVCSKPPEKPKHYLGAPEWYRALCPKASSYFDISWTRGPSEVSLSTATAPLLLKLSCHGKSLYRTHHHGWGYLDPKPTDQVILDQWIIKEHFPDIQILDPFQHDTRDDFNKDDIRTTYSENIARITEQKTFISKEGETPCVFVQYDFKKMHLTASHTGSSAGGLEAKQVLTLGTGLTSWRNTRSRILSQFVVDLQESDLELPQAKESVKTDQVGVILPQVVPAGTITRRSTEQLWLTASNLRADRVGSEFKGVVTPFPGYCFVGADVDSEELWIASLIGDGTLGDHGATPLGWMALQGQKSQGTDMHSKTAAELSQGTPGLVSRDMAKAFNYARIYGSGKGLARNMLKDCCRELSEDEVRDSIDKMYASTKGQEVYQLTNFGKQQASLHEVNVEELPAADINQLASITGHPRYKLANFSKSKYRRGSESAMFNRLEEIARSDQPATPFLKCRITRTLEPAVIQKSYQLNSRINWVVQSSAVDFLHLLLVTMKWLMKEYDIPGRFAISIHDEVRFHVPEEYKYEAALALQIANLLTRSFFSTRLGIHDLPLNVAFFSGVDIDKSLRKSVKSECITPSNPHGLSVSYGIQQGEELDIFELLEKANTLRVVKR